MAPTITRIQLENAARDADDLGKVSNEPYDYLGTGLVDSRFGGPIKTIQKVIYDIQGTGDATNTYAFLQAERAQYNRIEFETHYLGAFDSASEPTLDNEGLPLLDGTLYWNTDTLKLRVFNGTLWQDQSTAIGAGDIIPSMLDATQATGFRNTIGAVGFDDLPYVLAWKHGVLGAGADEHVAFQAIIDALPVEGGTIYIRGQVYLGTVAAALNFHGRRNIRIKGTEGSGNGTGSLQATMLRSGAQAIGVGVSVIDCSGTFNVSWENIFIYNNQATFNGVLLDYGKPTVAPGDDSAIFSINDCTISVVGTTARGLSLYGSTQGMFSNLTFSGKGILLSLQLIAGVGFCNVHTFRNCNIKPQDAQYPVSGSGEGLTFIGCNVQASSGDGVGRFWRTSLSQPFRGINLFGCTFYDANTAGGIWAEFYWGQALNIHGCMMGGADPAVGNNYGITLGGGGTGLSEPGVRGYTILGNSFRYMTAALSMSGTIANDNNAKYGMIGANSVFGGTPSSNLFTGVATRQFTVIFPNWINARPNDYGSRLNIQLPTASTSLNSGDWWANANVITTIP